LPFEQQAYNLNAFGIEAVVLVRPLCRRITRQVVALTVLRYSALCGAPNPCLLDCWFLMNL